MSTNNNNTNNTRSHTHPTPSGSNTQSTAPSPASTTGAGAAPKTRLSDAQKKANHIESEKKRREAIRAGFDALANIVPGMQGQGRSEAVVLNSTVEFLREQLRKKEDLRKQARLNGIGEREFEGVYEQVREAVGTAEGSGNGGGAGGAGGAGGGQ